MSRRWLRALLLAWVCLGPALVHAGRTCEAKPAQAQSIERAMNLAVTTARALDATGAQVVVLARVGQDLRKYGLRYSHLGLAYLEQPSVPETGVPGRWRVVHKLNQCGSALADVYRQGLGEFFMDDLFDYEAGVAVLSPKVQAKLLPFLKDDQRLLQLHQPAYNMLAYPWSQRYQQSNQWALETLALSLYPASRDRERVQAWLKLGGYEPTTLNIGAFTRLGARAGTANIAFDDHPNDKRYADRIETVTVDSVFQWLRRSSFAASTLKIR